MTRKTLLVYALLLLGVYLVFGQAAHFAYVEFDDPDYVYQNPFVSRGLSLRGAMWPFHADARRQLASAHLALAHARLPSSGLGPGGQHVVNFVLHGISACLLFTLLAQRLSRWQPRRPCASGPTPMVAAALRGASAPRVGSVALDRGTQDDVLGGLFFFLDAPGLRELSPPRPTAGPLSAGHSSSSSSQLMSKPMLVTLPLAALLPGLLAAGPPS